MTQPQPEGYQAALVAAAALRAQLAVSPDPVDVAEMMSDETINVRERAAEFASNQIRQLWRELNPYDGGSVQVFTESGARVMGSAQTAVARTTSAAQVRQLRSVGVTDVSVTPANPIDVRASDIRVSGGVVDLVRAPSTVDYREPVVDLSVERARRRVTVTVDEHSTQEVLNRPVRDYRYQRSQGATIAEAIKASENRIDRLVEDNLMLAQRYAEAEVLAQAADVDKRVLGYRRVIHPELSRGGACGMCIAASDRLYRVRELKAVHARCKCTIAAVTKDFDVADVLNKRDLSAFYADAQGNQVADLKRTRYQVDEHGELGAVLVPKTSA